MCEYESAHAFLQLRLLWGSHLIQGKTQVLLRPTKPCPFCPVPSSPSPPSALPLAHSVPVLQASLVFLGHIKQGPSSGSSHLLFPLPGMLLPFSLCSGLCSSVIFLVSPDPSV